MRKLTPRELACIQGFRWNYEFHGNRTAVQKQIGNAVPPYVWKQFVEQITGTLDDFYDGKIDQFGNAVPQQPSTASSMRYANPSRGIMPPGVISGPTRTPGHSPARASMSTSPSAIGVKRGGGSSAGIDGLSARTRAISISDDDDDDDDDVEEVGTPRKRACKGKGKEKVIDLTE
jgi:hypothetical protein